MRKAVRACIEPLRLAKFAIKTDVRRYPACRSQGFSALLINAEAFCWPAVAYYFFAFWLLSGSPIALSNPRRW